MSVTLMERFQREEEGPSFHIDFPFFSLRLSNEVGRGDFR